MTSPMHIVRTQKELTEALALQRMSGASIGYVPTMGALHAGHLSLVKCAKEHATCVVVSIFVNPTQFAPDEDFDQYPREEEKDARKLEEAGVDILFLPTQEAIYPDNMDSPVQPGPAAQGLEADFRPTHFEGVVNVVSRLFQAVQPDVAVFGEKDFQQLQVIREMVKTLGSDIEIIGAPIARDEYGLALSSRNMYLSDEERDIARQLNKIVYQATQDHDTDKAEKALKEAGFDRVDYVAARWGRILAAAWLGKTRLIDNMPSA